MIFSERIENLESSPIRKLIPYSDQAKANGNKVYHLNIGQPDIKTPKEYYEALKNFDDDVLSYASSQGVPELIDSFVKYFEKHDMHFSKNEMIITNGGSEALLFALLSICDNGDNVLIPEPFYTNYYSFLNIAGVNVNPITTKAEEGFNLPSKEEIIKLINPKTKGFLLSNPGNPTGKVYSREEVELIKDIALENDLFIISDEVYKEFTYDGLEFTSFAHFKEIEDRVILIDSISKRYSACGARIGCIATKNKELYPHLLKLGQSRLSVATVEQVAAANLINVPDSYMEEIIVEYTKRRDLVYNSLQDMDGVICKKPLGAFYVIAKLPVEKAEDFVIWLLTDFNIDKETVMLTPAEKFYGTKGLGKDEVRISYCLNLQSLTKAMHILKEGLKAYNNR